MTKKTQTLKKRSTKRLPTTDSLNARGRPSLEIEQARLQTLYKIAWRHFILHGRERASIQAIAREAGVSRQAIHSRFGNKQSFFEEVTGKLAVRFFDQAGFDPATEKRDPAIVLQELGLRMLDHMLLPETIELNRAIFGGLHQYPEMQNAQAKAIARATDAIAMYLKRIAEENSVDISGGVAARDFISLIAGLATPVILGLSPPLRPAARRTTVKDIVQRFLRGEGLS